MLILNIICEGWHLHPVPSGTLPHYAPAWRYAFLSSVDFMRGFHSSYLFIRLSVFPVILLGHPRQGFGLGTVLAGRWCSAASICKIVSLWQPVWQIFTETFSYIGVGICTLSSFKSDSKTHVLKLESAGCRGRGDSQKWHAYLYSGTDPSMIHI